MKTFTLLTRIRDGVEILKLQCPDCGVNGRIDQDQFHGTVSIQCDCGFHETVNLLKRLEDAALTAGERQ